MHQGGVVRSSSRLISRHHHCAELQVEQMRLKKQQQQQETGTGRKYKFVSQLNEQGFIEGAHLLPANSASHQLLPCTAEMKTAPQHPSFWYIMQ